MLRSQWASHRTPRIITALTAFLTVLCLTVAFGKVAGADASRVTLQDYSILIRLDDGSLYFHETWVVKNAGPTKVVPLTVNLHPGYSGLSVARGPAADKRTATAKGFEDTEGVEAGAEKEYVVSFRVPYTSGAATLDFTSPYPTNGVIILADQRLDLAGTGFAKGQAVSMGTNSYVEYDAAATKAGQSISVQVKAKPGASTGAGANPGGTASAGTAPLPRNDQAATAFLIAAALLLFGAIGLFVVVRSRGGARQSPTGRLVGEPATAPVQTGRGGLALDTPEKRELVERIADLDRRYEAGALDETEYHQERGRAKSRLAALILGSQTDSGGSAGSSGSSGSAP